jgi:O-antigen/teichoic acid export membrane protein
MDLPAHASDNPELLSKDSPVGSEKLLAGGYYKTIQGMIIGNCMAIWNLVVLPRLVPYPEVFGIISIVATMLGLVANVLDWGIWASMDIILAQAINSHDEPRIERYVRTMFTFKLINGVVYNAVIWIFLLVFFPKLQLTWSLAYFIAISFNGFRWFVGFMVVNERSVIAAQRFDYETYYIGINFGFHVVSRLFWLWIVNTYWYPTDPILACAIAFVISETIEIFWNWTIQAYFARRGKILNLRRLLKPGWDREALSHFFHYGKYIVGRQYLILLSELNSVLWVLMVNYSVSNPEQIIGFWALAVSSMGPFYMATNITGPLFPAIASSFYKKEFALIESYWLTAIKWYLLWCVFSIGFYWGWGELMAVTVSGEVWRTAGVIMRWMALGFFFKMGNDMLSSILNAINQPKLVMIGTALKIPVLIIGGLFFFDTIYGMAVTYILMEGIFFFMMYFAIKRSLHISTPTWVIVIPWVSLVFGMLICSLLFRIWALPVTILGFVISFIVFFIFYFLAFIWLGGFEVSDYTQFEGSLNMVIPNSKLPSLIVGTLRNIARISPFYGKFSSDVSKNVKNQK